MTILICNRDATAALLRAAGLPGEVRVYADALDQGPVLAVDGPHRAARAAFWATRGVPDALPQLEAWDRGVWDAAVGTDDVALWCEHDLFDQLALVRTLARMDRRDTLPPLALIAIDRHPEVPDFLGLGQLTPAQLAAVWPARVPITRAMLDEANAAWIALTAGDPGAVVFVATRAGALPFLRAALVRHLEELPDVTSGLARTERQLLDALARGTAEADLVTALHAIDRAYPITDVLLAATLAALRTAGLLDGTTVTGLGRDVLGGAADRVAMCGLDTWRGGVHLVSPGPLWRWDPARGAAVER